MRLRPFYLDIPCQNSFALSCGSSDVVQCLVHRTGTRFSFVHGALVVLVLAAASHGHRRRPVEWTARPCGRSVSPTWCAHYPPSHLSRSLPSIAIVIGMTFCSQRHGVSGDHHSATVAVNPELASHARHFALRALVHFSCNPKMHSSIFGALLCSAKFDFAIMKKFLPPFSPLPSFGDGLV